MIRPALLAALLAAPASAATLDVRVEGVANDEGTLLVAVCDRASFLRRRCPYARRAPAAPGEARLRFDDLAPGLYAVQAIHDENDNRDLDRSLLGRPKEGFGFSNDAPMRFGPPRFEDAAVAVGPEGAEARLRLRYE
jgi:uncharacterized protein (DUF2141 family)